MRLSHWRANVYAMTDKKDNPAVPVTSAIMLGAQSSKPFSGKLLSSTSIAPGALVTPTQLAGILFDSFLANGFFIEAHGQENVLVISSSTLGELGGLNPDTAEKALDILVSAIANELNNDPNFEKIGCYVSKDLRSFEIIFDDEPSSIDLQETLDAHKDDIHSAILFEGRVHELHAEGQQPGHA